MVNNHSIKPPTSQPSHSQFSMPASTVQPVTSSQHTPPSAFVASTTTPNSSPSDVVSRASTIPSKPVPPVRRGYTRPDLIKGGVSSTLLNTLDNFTTNIPPIRNQIDHGKKTHNRDMRGWITSLQKPVYAHLWDSLVNTLRSDSTAESYWGPSWDRHLCRYILGIVVSKDKSTSNPEGRSQTRQAVNNAIKRELDCHFEPKRGVQKHKSARSKTFRDLFREKCRQANVPVPPYEDSREGNPQTISTSAETSSTLIPPQTNIPSRSTGLSDPKPLFMTTDPLTNSLNSNVLNVGATAGIATNAVIDMTNMSGTSGVGAVSGINHLHSLNCALPANSLEDPLELSTYGVPLKHTHPFASGRDIKPVSYYGAPLQQQPKMMLNEYGSETSAKLQLLRSECSRKFGQTEWWKLKSDDHVRELPNLLVNVSLHELLAILLDFRWIMRTFQCLDYSKGMRQVCTEGYDILLSALFSNVVMFPAAETEGYRLIRNAIMFTLPIIKDDTQQKHMSFYAHLATQLTGRLLDLKRRFSNIASLLRSIELHAPRPWLRPLSRFLLQPSKTDIKLIVPSNGTFTPHLIVLSEDGTVLVTAGSTPVTTVHSREPRKYIHMIRIWDVETGKLRLENKDIPNFVSNNCLALSRDKTCISFKAGTALMFWHLKSTDERTTIAMEKQGMSITAKDVASITPTNQTKLVLTTQRFQDEKGTKQNQATSQPKIACWDTTEGTCVRRYSSVNSDTKCLDVSPDGKFFVSGHENGFIHLWNLEDTEGQPILSFQSALENPGMQPVSRLPAANSIQNSLLRSIISICYHERRGSKLVTAVLRDGKIRIWEIPPILLTSTGEKMMKPFMTTICRAVIFKRDVRKVQWSQERMYTCGEDRVPCEWEWPENDSQNDWRWYAIEKARDQYKIPLPTSMISVAKKSHYVATWLSKSPYVTVWDMSRRHGLDKNTAGSIGWKAFNSEAYRSHISSMPDSVDALDLERTEPLASKSNFGEDSENLEKQPIGIYPRIITTDFQNVNAIKAELAKFFGPLNLKSTARPVADLELRLVMDVGAGKGEKLELCFERPLICCESGEFLDIKTESKDSGIISGGPGVVDQSVDGIENGLDENSKREGGLESGRSKNGPQQMEPEQTRKGMAAVLEGGLVVLFELENRDPRRNNFTSGMPIKAEVGLISIAPAMGNTDALKAANINEMSENVDVNKEKKAGKEEGKEENTIKQIQNDKTNKSCTNENNNSTDGETKDGEIAAVPIKEKNVQNENGKADVPQKKRRRAETGGKADNTIEIDGDNGETSNSAKRRKSMEKEKAEGNGDRKSPDSTGDTVDNVVKTFSDGNLVENIEGESERLEAEPSGYPKSDNGMSDVA